MTEQVKVLKTGINDLDLFKKALSSVFEEDFEFHLKENHPLKIIYNSSVLYFEWYTAPRVEEVDDWDDEEDEW